MTDCEKRGCPEPELCRLLGSAMPFGHVIGRMYETWTGKAPADRPVNPSTAAQFRTAWLLAAGLTMEQIPERLRPQNLAPAPTVAPAPLLLGDATRNVLSALGITQERVASVVGSCGGCAARQQRLNELDFVVRDAVAKGIATTRSWLPSWLGGG